MRVGVFICHCGNNIAGTVDVAKVAEAARFMPGVVYATDYMYTLFRARSRRNQEQD